MKAIHSFNICPKAPHGSQMQCCNMRRRIGKHQTILEEQTYFKEVKSAKPGPGSQIRHVCPCEKDMKAIHSFNTCPKAPHGSQMQCCNMRRRIGKHQTILEEQTYFEEVKSAKPGPGSQIRHICPCEMDMKAIHSFNTCPKAPHGYPMQGCNMRRRIGKHQTILEEQMNFEEVKSAKPDPGSQIRHVCPCEMDMKAIHSFNTCPKAPHGSLMQCCNMRRRIGKHHDTLEEQTSFQADQSAKPGPGSKIRAVG